MSSIALYKVLSDPLRIRILNLLSEGPLCVCHLMEILNCEQVRMSKQLRYMKEQGLVLGERDAQWIIYRLENSEEAVLKTNLHLLRESSDQALPLKADLRHRGEVVERLCAEDNRLAERVGETCC